MTDTPNVGAPEWPSSGASPWLNHNTGFRIFDAFACFALVDEMDVSAPPGSCADGARYLISSSPSGDWVGHAEELAIANGLNASNGWKFAIVANEGTLLYSRELGNVGNFRYVGGVWVPFQDSPSVLSDLADIDTTGAQDGYVLRYDASNGLFYPSALTDNDTNTNRIQDMLDFASVGLADGFILRWDASNGVFYPSPDLTGTPFAGGPQDVPIMATAMTARTTNGPGNATTESTTNKVMAPTLDFDQSTIEYAQFMFPMPKSWNEGTITFKAIWTAAAGTAAQTVIWGLQAVAISDDDVLDAAFGSAQEVSDALTAVGDVMHTAFSSALTVSGSPADRDLVVFQLYRKASDGGDTLTADAKLIGIVLQFTTSAADDT